MRHACMHPPMQVRCMAAVLLMVGQRLEQPSVVSRLLDVGRTPRKPQYNMAPEVSNAVSTTVLHDMCSTTCSIGCACHILVRACRVGIGMHASPGTCSDQAQRHGHACMQPRAAYGASVCVLHVSTPCCTTVPQDPLLLYACGFRQQYALPGGFRRSDAAARDNAAQVSAYLDR